jgi:hypothetical protein
MLNEIERIEFWVTLNQKEIKENEDKKIKESDEVKTKEDTERNQPK